MPDIPKCSTYFKVCMSLHYQKAFNKLFHQKTESIQYNVRCNLDNSIRHEQRTRTRITSEKTSLLTSNFVYDNFFRIVKKTSQIFHYMAIPSVTPYKTNTKVLLIKTRGNCFEAPFFLFKNIYFIRLLSKNWFDFQAHVT